MLSLSSELVTNIVQAISLLAERKKLPPGLRILAYASLAVGALCLLAAIPAVLYLLGRAILS